MPDLTIESPDMERLISDLERFKKSAIPFAARDGLNATAKAAQSIWRKRIDRKFTIRNKFTTRGIKIIRVRGGRNVDAMESEVGALAPYMRLQEFGGTVRGAKGSKPIPTSIAAGQAENTKPRTKVIRQRMRQPNIKLGKRVSKGSRKRRNAIRIAMAVRKRRKFVLIETDHGKGIARVTGRKRVRVKLIWDLSKPSVRVKPSPTLGPALIILGPQRESIHTRAMIKQLRFHRVLGY